MIEELIIFSDALNFRLINLLKEVMTGVKYNKEALKDRLNELSEPYPELARQVDDFSVWLIAEMEG